MGIAGYLFILIISLATIIPDIQSSMSLLIVGSTSRITQNIVLHLRRQNFYSAITISDLLPTYSFHSRYYHLQKALAQEQSSTQVALTKLTRVEDLYKQVQQHRDVLYVTHDYFSSVTSKTKIMELTAELSKNKQKVVFATPLEYDHFGYADPTQNYLSSQEKVRSINKNATFLRSDIQDGAETLAYIHKAKGFLEDHLFSVPETFRPRIVSSTAYASAVAQALSSKDVGQVETFLGEPTDYRQVAYNREITGEDTCHYRDNIRNLVKKYTGLPKQAVSQA